MLAKITRGNQVTIPKAIVEKAHLKDSSPYVEVGYAHGVVYLKPVIVEERISPEQFDRFQEWALSQEKGDLQFDSLGEGIRHLKKRVKKS